MTDDPSPTAPTPDTPDYPSGVHDMPMEHYLALPHLSSSGVKLLMPPKGCPALFQHEQLTPPDPKPHFELGTAAHSLALGDGPEIVEIHVDNRKSPATRKLEEEIRARGAIPLISPRMRIVEAMAERLRDHTQAMALLSATNGKAEQTMIWERDGVLRRARPDWLPARPADGTDQLILVDYKTSASVAPDDLDKTAADFGYHLKAEWYCDGAEELGLTKNAAMAFIFQMSSPPYLVELRQYEAAALTTARLINEDAAALFKKCQESGEWPSFTRSIDERLMKLPPWYMKPYQERTLW